jgi:outer membrane protein assembly factor BamA
MKPLSAVLLSLALALGYEGARAGVAPLGIEALECRGNSRTPCDYILSHVELAVGENVDERAIDDARYRLASLPNFSSVDIYLVRGSDKGQARVIVEVVERDPLATEFVVGSSYYLSSISQRLAGRVMHQNLFGTGRILEAFVDTRIPLRDPPRKTLHVRAQYVDPHLFDANRYYFIAGVSHSDDRIEERNGSRGTRNETGADIAVGRRVWDFSYVALGYRYNWESSSSNYLCLRRDPCEFEDVSRTHIAALSYGWNSEDDPYFPTQGSRFAANVQVAADSHDTFVNGGIGFRKTWRTAAGALLTFNALSTPETEYRTSFEETFALGFSYGRSIGPNAPLGIIRGRWYLMTGMDQLEGYGDPTEISSRLGVKVGVRLHTKSFGIVDLYLMAVGEATLWGG